MGGSRVFPGVWSLVEAGRILGQPVQQTVDGFVSPSIARPGAVSHLLFVCLVL